MQTILQKKYAAVMAMKKRKQSINEEMVNIGTLTQQRNEFSL